MIGVDVRDLLPDVLVDGGYAIRVGAEEDSNVSAFIEFEAGFFQQSVGFRRHER